MANTRKHSSNSNNETRRNRYRLMKGGNETNVVTPTEANVVTPETNIVTPDEANVVTPTEAKDETSGVLSTLSGALSNARDSLQQFASRDNTQSSSDVDPKTTDDDDLEKNVDEIDETHEQLVDALEEAKDKYLELTNALKQKQRAEDTISKILEENPSFLTAIDSDAKSETINSQDTTLTEGRDQDDASQDDMTKEDAEDGNVFSGNMTEQRTSASQDDESGMTEQRTTNSFNTDVKENFDKTQSPPLSPREDN